MKPSASTPQPREIAELVFDEARQAGPVGAIRDVPQDGFQVVPDDGVEHGVLGVTGPIRGVGMHHTPG